MISPFSVEEKQKLMETILAEDKLNVLEEIINTYPIDINIKYFPKYRNTGIKIT